ncbi:DUF6771 family protein [Novosphingobium sp. KA1]|uniref:DUF6771 family protein n=1 Tax=Novosphingobium sp. (strain KA1) TaxID=164608 RepID=UPI001A8F2672|nr:DUF6771 family protein [Novosphingobium sp. KA1]QSR19311.1 hypothetical protein CA833_19225 [Novosphingobium sp. KA1]
MERLDPQQLSEAILTAPAWARVGITMRDERMRLKAAAELAQSIVERLSDYPAIPDPDQLKLFP